MPEIFQNIYCFIYTKTGEFDEIIFSFPFVVIAAVIYGLKRKKLLRKQLGDGYEIARRDIRLNELCRLLFFCWSAMLVFTTLTPPELWGNIWRNILSGHFLDLSIWRFSLNAPKLVPIFIKYAAAGRPESLFDPSLRIIPHLAVNILLFVPFGALLPVLKKNITFAKCVLIGLSMSVIIELAQMFLCRDSDIDDVICNTLGAMAGYLVFALVKRRFPRFVEKCGGAPPYPAKAEV